MLDSFHQELGPDLSIQKPNTRKKQQSKLLTVDLKLCALTLSLFVGYDLIPIHN